MNLSLSLVLFLVIFTLCSLAKDSEPANKNQLIVNEENEKEFGLPIGTVLKEDHRTGLYKPPHLSSNFTADDRIKLTWNNQTTRKSYCKVGPGQLKSVLATYNYYWHTWCRNNDGDDICCDNKHCKCKVNFLVNFDCECTKNRYYD